MVYKIQKTMIKSKQNLFRCFINKKNKIYSYFKNMLILLSD